MATAHNKQGLLRQPTEKFQVGSPENLSLASLKIGCVWLPTIEDFSSNVKFVLPSSRPSSCSPRGLAVAP